MVGAASVASALRGAIARGAARVYARETQNGRIRYGDCVRLTAAMLRRGAVDGAGLDKACLNQGNIQQSLLCLPINLAFSRTLLVLVGQTYTSRLWVRPHNVVRPLSWSRRL